MAKLTLSEKYALAATGALIVMMMVNSALVMLVLSVLGIAAGVWVWRKGETRRVAFVAFAGFVIAAVFAIMGLVSAG